MTRPAPARPAVSRNSRRVTCGALMSRSLRGAMDGGADALVGAAATDVGHRRVDVGVGGVRILREQRRGGHDLPRLADRKSTRLNSSHPSISYAVFCLKKKTK